MTTVQVKPWMIKLAAKFLEEYSDRLSNDGCNDFEVPIDVPIDELNAILHEWNKGPIEDDENLSNYNHCVVAGLGNAFERMLK